MDIPPNPYTPNPGPGAVAPNYQDTYPMLGLSGLAQGFTHGIELGHEWGHQADELDMRKQQLENEAGYRNALIGSRASLILSEIGKNNALAGAVPQKLAQAATAETDRNTRAAAALAAKGAAAAGKAADKNAAPTDMLDSLGKKWDALGAGPVAGTELSAKSVFPSSDAAGYSAARTAMAGKIDHDLNGRVNDFTIKSIKDALPGFYDSPESKAQKMAFISQTYKKALGAAPPAGAAPAGGAGVYATPQAQAIKAQYAAGKMSKEQASTALDALHGS